MIEGLDKEIDSLLRRAATGETVQTFDAPHLDADEIALFAENALPVKARTRAVTHLAECAKCRKILSHLITFNAEEESVQAAEENNVVTVAPVVPWYRRFFAFPQLTYAMGALAVIFAGVIAFIVLQQQTNFSSNSATVAQREDYSEKSRGTGGASSDGQTTANEQAYSSNMSNAASVSATPFDSSNATTSTANTTANTTVFSSNSNANVSAAPRQQMPVQMQQQSNDSARSGPTNNFTLGAQNQQQNAPPASPNIVTDGMSVMSAPESKEASDKAKSAELAKNERQDAKKRDEERKRLGETPADDRSNMSAQSMTARKSAKPQPAGDARSIGGKSFRNVGGIWFDSAYGSQQQTMIRRGTEDYRKLDSGLRSIAENLSGTVVVLWKGRAYRIN